MPKKSKSKAAATASAIAPLLAKGVAKEVKAHKGKVDWKSVLKGGVRIAADLAPAILPMLLASHGASKMAVSSLPPSAGVPLAQEMSLGSQVGLKSLRVSARDSKGSVTGVTVTTLDLVSSSGASGYSAGDVIFDWYLHPLAPEFEGTKWQEFATMYTKYRVRNLVILAETLAPATLAGAQVMAIFDDPLTDLANLSAGDSPQELLQVAGSQAGSETAPVWSACCCHYVPPIGNKAVFIDPDGSDPRLTMVGRAASIAASDIAAGTAFSNYYVLAETEFSIPTVSALNTTQSITTSTTTGGLPTSVLGTDQATTTMVDRLGPGQLQFKASFHQAGTPTNGNAFSDLAPGGYIWSSTINATGLTSAVLPFIPDEAANYGIDYDGFDMVGAPNGVSQGYLVIPPGIPANVPMVCWEAKGTTFVDSTFQMARCDLDVLSMLSKKIGGTNANQYKRAMFLSRFSTWRTRRDEALMAATVQRIQSLEASLAALASLHPGPVPKTSFVNGRLSTRTDC